MGKIGIILQLLLSLFSICAFSKNHIQLQKNDVSSWTNSQADEFGCFLEKKFNHKDKKFNCELKKYINKGDPCENKIEYYEGPKFPSALSSKVNSKIKDIDLSWERGKLQSIEIKLAKKYSNKEIQTFLKLPPNASIQDCSDTNTCIVILGFDHFGSGDADCGD